MGQNLPRYFARKDVQMANKCIKSGPYCVSSEKCKLKQQWVITTYLLEWSKPQNRDNTKCWWGYAATGTHLLLMELKMEQPLWKTTWQFLKKLNTLLPCEPTILLLSISSEKLKNVVHTETCTWMFIAALLTVTKTWRKPRCPSVGEWINKLWCIQTMEYYSALKRNELSNHVKTRGQSGKSTSYMIPIIWHYCKEKTVKIVKKKNHWLPDVGVRKISGKSTEDL